MQIRPYHGTDEADLLALWNASMAADQISEDLFRIKVLLDPNFVSQNLSIAIDDGKLVGFVLLITRQVPFFGQGMEPESAWITAFGVHPDYRRRGIGTALFNHVISHLNRDNRRSLDISPYVPNYFVPGVDVDAYPEAISLLRNGFGFKEIERATSMGASLTSFQIPPAILELERRREREDGITIRPITSADLPDVMRFISNHFGWCDSNHNFANLKHKIATRNRQN